MSSTHHRIAISPDHYASLVAGKLVENGLSRAAAVDVVQSRERAVRASHAKGEAPAKVANKILARRGLAGGMSPKSVAQAAGCELVPVEGFFFSDDVADLPPLQSCEPVAYGQPGYALGKADKRRRALRSSPGRVAGGFSDEGMLHQITVAASERVGEEQMVIAAKHIFGRKVLRSEFERTFSAEIPDAFQKARLTSMMVSAPKRGVPETLKLLFTLNTGAPEAGKMNRVYYRDPAGIPQAYHGVYEIDGRTNVKTGRGLGAAVTKQTLEFYKSLGVGSIDTHAEWVGRYVWAAFGFQWSSWEADNKAEELARYLKDRVRRGQYQLVGRAGNFQFDLTSHLNPWKKFEELLEARAITNEAWKTAGLFLQNPAGELEHVGKPFLAGVPSPEDKTRYLPGQEGAESWTGTLVLNERHPTWNVAKRRLGL